MRENVSGIAETGVCTIVIALTLIILEPTFIDYTRIHPEDFYTLNSFLRGHSQYGDYMLFNPKWLRGYTRDIDKLQFIPDYSENVFTRGLVDRIWFVSIGEQEPKTELAVRLVNTTEIGRLNVRLYEVTKKPTTFRDMLATSEARIGTTEGVLEGDKIAFEGLPDWANIAPTTEYFHGDGHNGLLFHPVSNERKILEFYDIPSGVLYFTYGLKPRQECDPDGRVNLTLTVNNEIALTDFLLLKNGGARKKSVKLPEDNNKVIVEATTADDQCLHFFINGYIEP